MATRLGVSGHSPTCSDKHQLSACLGFGDGVSLCYTGWPRTLGLRDPPSWDDVHISTLTPNYYYVWCLPLDAGLYLAVPWAFVMHNALLIVSHHQKCP